VLAIGGITADKVASIAAAGAAGVAAIGLFADLQRDATDDAVAMSLRRLVGDLRAAFHGGAAGR
jgi:thiamine monophosphate synthase